MLQKPGIGGRSWHLWCLHMFQSMSKLVRVLVAASNRLSRFLRRRLRRCVSKSRSQLSWVLLRCLCVALVVTIARGEHCACVSAHTHMCAAKARDCASACGDSLIVPEQLPVCCKELLRLASSGASYDLRACVLQIRRTRARGHSSASVRVCVCVLR